MFFLKKHNASQTIIHVLNTNYLRLFVAKVEIGRYLGPFFNHEMCMAPFPMYIEMKHHLPSLNIPVYTFWLRCNNKITFNKFKT